MPNVLLNVTDTNENLTIHGRHSIIGRSLVIADHTDKTINLDCGTIRSIFELEGR